MGSMDWKKRLEIVQEFYNTEKIVLLSDGSKGYIDKLPQKASGLWGYGGDSIVVYVNSKPYPSNEIVKLNLNFV